MTEDRAEGFERYKLDWLRLGDITRHPRIQRPYRESRAKDMAEVFDPELFGTLDVVVRNNKFYVFGGQHRHGAALIALGPDQRVPCHVHEDAALEDQARICLGRDNTVAWKTIDKWPLRIIAKEEIPVKIEVVLHLHNLVVGNNTSNGIVRATRTLETIWNQYGGEETLDRTLGILIKAYGTDRACFDAILLHGLGYLLHALPSINDEELTRKLSKHSGPVKMIGGAKDYAKAVGCVVFEAMADRMLHVYNTRRTSQLELPRRKRQALKAS